MKTSKPFSSLERILVVRLDNIGDVVMLSPALRALREACPQARITFMASPAGSQVAPLLPWVDEVLPWRASWQDISPNPVIDVEKERELVRILEQGRFDAAFIFTSFSQSPYPPAYACYLAGIPMRVAQSNEFGGALLSHWIRPLSEFTHQVDRNLYLLSSMGLPVHSDALELVVPEEYRKSAGEMLQSLGIAPQDPFIALAPGASAASRRYETKRFAEAVRWLHAQADVPVVLLGSAREKDAFSELEALAQPDPGQRRPLVHSLIGKTNVPEMAEIIRHAAVVLANNSGSMHMAAAFRRPMVILFSGTEKIEQWNPRTENVIMLNRPTECSPCYSFQCPYAMECLDIPAEEVASAVLSLFQKPARHPASIYWAAGVTGDQS